MCVCEGGCDQSGPVDECVFVLEKARSRLYSCTGLCFSKAEVCLVRNEGSPVRVGWRPTQSMCVCVCMNV